MNVQYAAERTPQFGRSVASSRSMYNIGGRVVEQQYTCRF